MIQKKRLLTGGQAAVKSLKKEKVKHVFGFIGSATMEMIDALYNEKKIKCMKNIEVKDITGIYKKLDLNIKSER